MTVPDSRRQLKSATVETAEAPALTRLQRMRQRFEQAEGDRDRVMTAKPGLTAKRKVDDTVTVTAGRRKAPKLVAGVETETVVTASPVEETETSGQNNLANNPHLLSYSETGPGGQRGGGQSLGGGVLGGVQGHQVGQCCGEPAVPDKGTGAASTVFKSSQQQPWRESLSEKLKKAVIGSAAACGSASTNGGTACGQLLD